MKEQKLALEVTAEKIVDIVSSLLGLNSSFIDASSGLRLAGTGYAKKLIGKRILSDSAVWGCAATGKNATIWSPGNDESCNRCESRQSCFLYAQVLCPIKYNEAIIGVINIVALNQNERERLLYSGKKLLQIQKAISTLFTMAYPNESQVLLGEAIAATDWKVIGKSSVMLKLLEKVQLLAPSRSSVLLQGETGIGKEMFARLIHEQSIHRNGPFIAINCAGIPENLLESELFGYVEGAFTGAAKGGKPGKLELANGGSLFLDEIGDMPIQLQAKLLRVLSERTMERIGDCKSIPLDFRLISATNQCLTDLISKGLFRKDLYYRLKVISLTIPPLRERRSDIMELAHYFLSHYNAVLGKNISGFSPEARRIFCSYDWPGNVRELRNTVECAVNLETGNTISVSSLDEELTLSVLKSGDVHLQKTDSLKDLEQSALVDAMKYYGTTLAEKEAAARALGISRATLYRRLKKLETQKN